MSDSLEEQFILRLPQTVAKDVSEAFNSGKSKRSKKLMKISLDERKGTLIIAGKSLHAKLVDLPCIVDSLKTIDGKSLFKTADISQMLICQEEPFEEEPHSKPKKYPHGIAPPMKNVLKRRFRRITKNKGRGEDASEVEKEVIRLLRMDNDAVSTRFELIDEDRSTVDEKLLFGEDTSDSSEGETSVSICVKESTTLPSYLI